MTEGGAKYLKLAAAPRLIVNSPECEACLVETDNDGNGFVCPSCGTSWSNEAHDGDTGTLYEGWSGESLPGPGVSIDDAWRLRTYRTPGEKYLAGLQGGGSS